MLKVAVIGSKGRMGSKVCQAVEAAEDMELVDRLDVGDDITARLRQTGATHAVDFTIPTAAQANVMAALQAQVHVVVGTTGWSEEAYDRVRQAARSAERSVLIAPNFAISAVLAMKFAALAAPYFESVEILEMHHPDKLDAPSGTAIATAKGIAAARRGANAPALPDSTTSDALKTRGGKVEDIPIHAIRLRGLYAHEEILFGNPGEQLVMRTDCFDRASFMPGVLLGLRKVADTPGLTIGLDSLLGL